MKEQDKWRDQHGKTVTEVTSEQSIEVRVKEITSKSKDTPISYQQERVVEVCRNELAPLLDKIVDKDGKIPSGKQVSDIQDKIQEEFHVTYFNSLTVDNPPDPVSSEDEATKTERLDDIVQARTNKLHKFHPMDLYIYIHLGPTNVGGCVRPYFLESVPAIQKGVEVAECTNREDLYKRNDHELLEKAQGKKNRRLFRDTVDEMEECGPTTSFGETYDKQLEFEEVCVETECSCERSRSRERRRSQVELGDGHTRASLGTNWTASCSPPSVVSNFFTT
jgi:hypothetical protein